MFIKPFDMNSTPETSTQYQEYLQSWEWRKRAEERLRMDNNACQMCGAHGTTANPLNVHHLTYHNIYKEDPNKDLVTLCKCCHVQVHTMMNRITNSATGQRGWKDKLIPYLYTRNVDGIHQEFINGKE